MNIKPNLLTLLFSLALLAGYWVRMSIKHGDTAATTTDVVARESSAPPKALPATVIGQNQSEITNLSLDQQRLLTVIKAGFRSLETEDLKMSSKLAKDGSEAMKSFLKTWDPIGRTPQDITALFGKPKEETADFVLYSFDNGYIASHYQFDLRNGRVVKLSFPPAEGQ